MDPNFDPLFPEGPPKGPAPALPDEALRILVAEDDDSFREMMQDFLKSPRRKILGYKDGREAVRALRRESFDLVVTDLMMPGADGMAVLKEAKERNPECAVILITGYASLDSALQAIRGGAYDYLRKPFKLEELEVAVKNACEKIALVRENRELLSRLKETMEEMKRRAPSPGIRPENPPEGPAPGAGSPLSRMDVLLNQMIPPRYEAPLRDPRERAIEDLEKLIRLRKEGFLDALEFYSLKKMLLEPEQS